jgi:RNA ligase
VNYDFSGLVYLASIDRETGKQIGTEDYPVCPYVMVYPPLRKARAIKADNLEELLKMDEPNSEGFVIYWPEENVRMKIKFPEYVRLHKLVTGVSEIAIWEHMRDGKSLDDLLNKVPDEFFKWVTSVENRLRAEHAKLWGEAMLAREIICGLKTRKEQALEIMKKYKNVSGVVFSLLDGEDKKAVQSVWKMVRPHGNSQFKLDVDL